MLKLNLKPLFQLYGEQFVNDIIARMNEQDINATGNAARNLRFKASPLGLQVEGDRYLTAVDNGRGAGKRMPPRRSLESWIEAKVAPGIDEKSMKKLSFAIAKAISTNGTIKRFGYKGADFIDFVINKNSQSLVDDVAIESLEQIGQSIEGVFKTYKDIQVI